MIKEQKFSPIDEAKLESLKKASEKNSNNYNDDNPFGPTIEERYPGTDPDLLKYISHLENVNHQLMHDMCVLKEKNTDLQKVLRCFSRMITIESWLKDDEE